MDKISQTQKSLKVAIEHRKLQTKNLKKENRDLITRMNKYTFHEETIIKPEIERLKAENKSQKLRIKNLEEEKRELKAKMVQSAFRDETTIEALLTDIKRLQMANELQGSIVTRNPNIGREEESTNEIETLKRNMARMEINFKTQIVEYAQKELKLLADVCNLEQKIKTLDEIKNVESKIEHPEHVSNRLRNEDISEIRSLSQKNKNLLMENEQLKKDITVLEISHKKEIKRYKERLADIHKYTEELSTKEQKKNSRTFQEPVPPVEK